MFLMLHRSGCVWVCQSCSAAMLAEGSGKRLLVSRSSVGQTMLSLSFSSWKKKKKKVKGGKVWLFQDNRFKLDINSHAAGMFLLLCHCLFQFVKYSVFAMVHLIFYIPGPVKSFLFIQSKCLFIIAVLLNLCWTFLKYQYMWCFSWY